MRCGGSRNSAKASADSGGKVVSYDLQEIDVFCSSQGLPCRWVSPDEIRVQVASEIELCFANIEDGTDTYLGFSDSRWHTHDELVVMTNEITSIALSPIEVLKGLLVRELLISSSYSGNMLKDRWIFHRKEKQDFQYVKSGESITIQTAEPCRGANTLPCSLTPEAS